MMACESRAGLEAQKLISISLGKMAASRVGRTGASLHKSLLVASVLHRARHVFLEESYHLHRAQHPEAYVVHPTPVYAPMPPTPPPTMQHQEAAEAEDKENVACEPVESSQQPEEQLPATAEPARTPLQDNNTSNNRVAALKRRRCVSEQETQDAVSSILPKKAKTCPAVPSSPPQPQQTELSTEGITDVSDDEDGDCGGNSMEVEHITSLVSIFSFGGQRSSELCATQAAREDNQTFQPVVALAVE
ncbi:unnamed protein product, partial [Meganyctiphanes norvegica]